MKNLKRVFSFMLVGVLLITSSIALTGCFKKGEDELTKQEKIEIALAVVNDAKLKFEKAQTFEVGQTIESDANASMNLFTQYGNIVSDNKEELTTITQDYYNDNLGWDSILTDNPINEILALLNKSDFEFGVKYDFEDAGDEGKQILEFNSSFIRYIILFEDGVESDAIIFDIDYKNKKATNYKTYSEDEFIDVKFSTSENRALDSIENVNARELDDNGEDIGYYCTLYSEINGHTFTLISDTIKLIGGSTENVAQMFESMKTESGYDVFSVKCKEKIDASQKIINSYLN